MTNNDKILKPQGYYLNLALHTAMCAEGMIKEEWQHQVLTYKGNIKRILKYYGYSMNDVPKMYQQRAMATAWLRGGDGSQDAFDKIMHGIKNVSETIKNARVNHARRIDHRNTINEVIDALRKHTHINEIEISLKLARSKSFYNSPEWHKLRYFAFERYGNYCACCGRRPDEDDAVLHVDHILPRSYYPEFALNIHNMQILCELCNIPKSNESAIQWRGGKLGKYIKSFGRDHTKHMYIGKKEELENVQG
jgi:5-methylcytosine-specific restriction endonuclease McrA